MYIKYMIEDIKMTVFDKKEKSTVHKNMMVTTETFGAT